MSPCISPWLLKHACMLLNMVVNYSLFADIVRYKKKKYAKVKLQGAHFFLLWLLV